MLELKNKYTKREFASFIKNAREQTDLNIKEFAEAIGFSSVSVSLWEKGRRLPDDPYAVAYEIIESLKGEISHVRNN